MRRTGDALRATLPPRSQGVRLQRRDAVKWYMAFDGSPHVYARNVSHLGPLMPHAWLSVETNDGG